MLQHRQSLNISPVTSLQTDNHANTPPLSFFTGRMPFLPPNQQHQSTEGTRIILVLELLEYVVINNKKKQKNNINYY